MADRRQVASDPIGADAGENPGVSVLADDPLALAAERAALRLAALEDLQARCGEMSEMDLDFLYDSDHKLLSIGYNVDTHQTDPGYYDLLASEARLCSFLGIARGQVPLEHWFHLGRQLAPGGGAAVLVSWSGSMFEYLMPLLLMPNYDATLLEQSCREAVAPPDSLRPAARRALGHLRELLQPDRRRRESTSTGPSAFPAWGSSTGCSDDLVVAPYATVLALMVDPRAACRQPGRDGGARASWGATGSTRPPTTLPAACRPARSSPWSAATWPTTAA